jgi:diacylglycerol kinase
MANQQSVSPAGESGSKVPRNANLFASLRTALHGLLFVVTSEPNFRIHCLATGAIAAAAVWLGVSRQEAVLLTFACVIVLGAEMINTTLERIVNLVSPQWQEDARLAKDAAAGMVLITVAGASLCGLLIFGPYVW